MTGTATVQGTGGHLLYETLRSYGVDCIFGMEDPIHLFHAVDRASTRIVTIHDERHAAIMAHGYAQVSGRPGVCASTYGPGAANLAAGLHEAQRSSVPVIALVQDHSLRLKGRHANSELDHHAALSPYVKAILRIDYADQAGDVVRRAFRLACSGRPGPVAILCPTDVMAAEAEAMVHADLRFARYPALRPVPGHDDVALIAAALAGAKVPVIVAGGGAMISGAFDEVRQLAEQFGAPVVTTLTGRGIIADSHPLAMGAIGGQTGGYLGRGRAANEMLAKADTVLLLGTKTGQLAYADWTLPKPGVRLLHLDIDPSEPGRNLPTDATMIGDVRDSLRLVLAHAEAEGMSRDAGDAVALIAEGRGRWLAANRPYTSSEALPMRPERLMAELDARLPEEAIIVCDGSYSSGWVLSHVTIRRPSRTILSPRGTGSIGWAYAAALGAKVGAPHRPVVCVTGDGGFYYMIAEMETAARYGIAVTTIVLNNGTLGFQRHYEQKAFGSYRECDFLPVDFAALARVLRCEGERVESPGDLGRAIERGFAHDGPFVLDAVISPEIAAPVPGFEREIDTAAGH